MTAQLLERLGTARWDVAHRTYGSSHATLIGILNQWWIDQSVGTHSVLDGAPSHGFKNAGQADLLLCADNEPAWVVEVEGTQALQKIRSLAKYFAGTRPELASLKFGLLMVYAYEAKGVGAKRFYPSAEVPELTSLIQEVTSTLRRDFFLLIADKQFERVTNGIRAVSGYYHGRFHRITGICYREGQEVARRSLFEA
jgi:hypothetical protein